MTNEEIIAILESYKKYEDSRTEDLLHHGYDNTKEATKRKEALDEAIKALSENTGDLIRRIEVESVLHNNLHALIDTDQLNQLYKDINRLHAYSFPDSAENLNMEREQAYYRGYEDGIQKGRESAENKGEWIPITEGMELPEHDVICCDNEGNIALGYLYFDEEENQIACDRDPYVMFGVVAYMELPEPYKEGE